MNEAQFQRETTKRDPVVIPDGLLEEWRTLAENYGLALPNYCTTYDYWGLRQPYDCEKPADIVDQVQNSVERTNTKVREWNKKVDILLELGPDHLFVIGYVSQKQPGWWRMSKLHPGDGNTPLCKKRGVRSVQEFLDYIAVGLYSIWPTGFSGSTMAETYGYFAAEHFSYCGRMPDFSGVDIGDPSLLSDFVTRVGSEASAE